MGILGGHNLPDFIVNDLANQGLEPHDLNARLLDNAERAATGTSAGIEGYVLPYFDMSGKLRPFYRVALLSAETKFRQPTDSPNHLYFPKTFQTTLGIMLLRGASDSEGGFVIITVGEKGAAAATKAGFPTVGISSSTAWRNRTLLISGDANLSEHRKKLSIRLPANEDPENMQELQSTMAVGLLELIDLIVLKKLTVVIVFDTNNVTREVDVDDQRAAASFAFELRFRGIPFHKIRQLILPSLSTNSGSGYTKSEVTLGSFLSYPPRASGIANFKELLAEILSRDSAFPLHPNPRAHVNERLARSKHSRKELQDISLSVLSDLDGRGRRLRSLDGQTYYFDHTTFELLLARWPTGSDEQYQGAFTQYLYKRYGLAATSSDRQVLIWLGTQFASEDPIKNVIPQRVIAYDVSGNTSASADRVLFQISDSQYIETTASGFKIHNNGDGGVLFQSDQVEPLNPELLLKEITSHHATMLQGSTQCYWAHTLGQVRLRDKDKQRIVAALLYYMSPWLFRWRGMQLPVELVVGESGSGKSTLCELRLDILTGRPYLRNAPHDIKDWYASILNTGGLHVTDNVQFADKALRQQLSDELCRIVTEPDPFVEQRKYYTNAELIRIPVRAIFAVTAIQQPFVNADILQRSFILELDKSIEISKALPQPQVQVSSSEDDDTDDAEDSKAAIIIGGIRYDSSWKAKQLASRGGREGWIAHHLVVLQRFFQLAQESWDDNYQAKHRLINFEQSILIMAKIFNIPSTWIPNFLATAADHAVTETDWVMSGLHEFSLEHNTRLLRQKKFFTSTVSDWAAENEDYKGCDLLTNAHKLSKYMKAHKSALFQLTGILEIGKEANRTFYQFRGQPLPRRET